VLIAVCTDGAVAFEILDKLFIFFSLKISGKFLGSIYRINFRVAQTKYPIGHCNSLLFQRTHQVFYHLDSSKIVVEYGLVKQ